MEVEVCYGGWGEGSGRDAWEFRSMRGARIKERERERRRDAGRKTDASPLLAAQGRTSRRPSKSISDGGNGRRDPEEEQQFVVNHYQDFLRSV